jgi:hypothetical protein
MNTIDIITRKLHFYFLILKGGRGTDFQEIGIIPESKLKRQANPASGAAEIKLIVFGMGGGGKIRKSRISFMPENVPIS